jgi:8-oxo-dGTP diphosphatase
MTLLRTSVFVNAPESTVRAALTELDRVSTERLPPGVSLTASADQHGSVTLLVCVLECPTGGRLGHWMVATFLRRRMLAVLDEACALVQRRALRLAAMPVVVGTAVVADGRLLAQQRAYPSEIAGRWELPGGRVESGEAEPSAVARECLEELGVRIRVGSRVGPDVALPGDLLLRVYAGSLTDGDEPRAHEHRAVRWLGAGELDTVDWLEPDRVLLPALRELLAS